MEHVSLAGVAVAVIAVFVAYFMGYTNGVALGRDEGYGSGKKEGSREDSIRAYADGFHRGKRSRDDDDDDDDDDEDDGRDDDGARKPNLGFAILAVAAGLFGILWLSSSTPTATPPQYQQGALIGELEPVADPDALVRPAYKQSSFAQGAGFKEQPTRIPSAGETLALPRVNRALPTATPVPSNGAQYQYRTPAEVEHGAAQFAHPPQGFQSQHGR